MNRFANIRIEVHWIDKIHFWIFVFQVTDCGHHVDEAFAEILPAVSSDENKFLAVSKSFYVITCIKKHFILLCYEGGIALKFVDHHV